ncbi:MAG TPA: hypothetical protein VF104_06015, partial [Burkholderiales bacterium]
ATDENGAFDLPRKWEGFWGPLLPIDTFPPKVVISVAAEGFEATEFDPYPYRREKSRATIKLVPNR